MLAPPRAMEDPYQAPTTPCIDGEMGPRLQGTGSQWQEREGGFWFWEAVWQLTKSDLSSGIREQTVQFINSLAIHSFPHSLS